MSQPLCDILHQIRDICTVLLNQFWLMPLPKTVVGERNCATWAKDTLCHCIYRDIEKTKAELADE